MKREFVPIDLSLKLKELGFDEPCFGYYVDGELRGINLGVEELGGIEPYYQRFGFHTLSNHNIDNPNKIVVTAPTFSQAFRFFREKYKLCGLIEIGTQEFSYQVFNNKGNRQLGTEPISYNGTYEEAELECLKELIEIVETKSE